MSVPLIGEALALDHCSYCDRFGTHEAWCRQTVPLRIRVEGFIKTLKWIGRKSVPLTQEEMAVVGIAPSKTVGVVPPQIAGRLVSLR